MGIEGEAAAAREGRGASDPALHPAAILPGPQRRIAILLQSEALCGRLKGTVSQFCNPTF
jgi:hypothetical protein